MLLFQVVILSASFISVLPFPEKKLPILKDEVMDSLKKLDEKKDLEIKQKEMMNQKEFKSIQVSERQPELQEAVSDEGATSKVGSEHELENGHDQAHIHDDEHEDDEDEDEEEEEEITEMTEVTEKETESTTTKQPVTQDDDDGMMCEKEAVCFSDSDCYGGQCVGLGVNRCACLSCNTGAVCSGKHGCGGLKGACNRATSRCDCEGAFKKHGYTSLGSALYDLCNVRYCVPNTDSCFGMPCNSGTCSCPK